MSTPAAFFGHLAASRTNFQVLLSCQTCFQHYYYSRTHMKNHKQRVLNSRRVAESQHKSDRAPNAEQDKYNRDQNQLLVRNGSPRLECRRAWQDGAVLGERCVLEKRKENCRKGGHYEINIPYLAMTLRGWLWACHILSAQPTSQGCWEDNKKRSGTTCTSLNSWGNKTP